MSAVDGGNGGSGGSGGGPEMTGTAGSNNSAGTYVTGGTSPATADVPTIYPKIMYQLGGVYIRRFRAIPLPPLP
jgi:hypothetical protein